MIHSITDVDRLREKLRKTESEIEKLAYSFHDGQGYFCISNRQKILEKMKERAKLLDRLFVLHFNDADYARLSKINSKLDTYEQILIAKHKDMYAILQAVDKRFSLRSTIEYWNDDEHPQLEPLDDDAYYGSKWNQMMDILVLAELVDNVLFQVDDDGWTPYTDEWREYEKASFSIAPDAKPCYTFWDLIRTKLYSIPDVLQMTTYKYRHEALMIGDDFSTHNADNRIIKP